MADGNDLIEQDARGDECVLLHDSLPPDHGTDPESERGSILFHDPVGTITCWQGSSVSSAFEACERALTDGLYVAGAFAYELGYHLERKLEPLAPTCDQPLFQVGVFRSMTHLSSHEADAEIRSRNAPSDIDSHDVGMPQYTLDRPRYDAIMARLHEYILGGDIYQANFTFPLHFPWHGDVWQLYNRVAPHQKVAFGAVVDLPRFQLASLSPELFFRKRGRTIESRPMKGTMRRGQSSEEDDGLREMLHVDPKNRAENLMIVDLIRNDLGRMAEIGSVVVENLFQVETYGTLHQMVSTVRAEVAGEPTLQEIFEHLFPCGSITGAPKIRAMEIIAELEAQPRGVYTGAIGYATPDRDMCMSVPIRTMSLNRASTDGYTATMGIGSGVVADSNAVGEYEECLLKARFLHDALVTEDDRPGLIETMRSVDGKIPLLKDHQSRLRAGVAYLGIDLDADVVWHAVLDHASSHEGERRVRLQVNADGSWRLASAFIVDEMESSPVVVVGSEKLRSDDPMLGHKTTHRAIYNRARTMLDNVENGFDVLLFNERDELCEGAVSNVFLMLDDQLVTPDQSCGLLPGIMRSHVIAEQGAVEKILFMADLCRAEKVYLSNAVRGLFEVRLQR